MENRNLVSVRIFRISAVILLMLLCCRGAFVLEPDEILVIANKDIEESMRLARYYCTQRGVPDKNILSLPLGAILKNNISRNNYEKQLVEPIRKKFFTERLIGEIKCLLTIYVVTIKVGGLGLLKDQEGKLNELNNMA